MPSGLVLARKENAEPHKSRSCERSEKTSGERVAKPLLMIKRILREVRPSNTSPSRNVSSFWPKNLIRCSGGSNSGGETSYRMGRSCDGVARESTIIVLGPPLVPLIHLLSTPRRMFRAGLIPPLHIPNPRHTDACTYHCYTCCISVFQNTCPLYHPASYVGVVGTSNRYEVDFVGGCEVLTVQPSMIFLQL